MLYTGLVLYYADPSVQLLARVTLFPYPQRKESLQPLIRLLLMQLCRAQASLYNLAGRRGPSSCTPVLCNLASHTLGRRLTCVYPRSLLLFPSILAVSLYRVSNFLQQESSLSYYCFSKRTLSNLGFYITSYLI